jgi:hypothetical protein
MPRVAYKHIAFWKKNIFFNFEKRLAFYSMGAVVVNSKVVGLAPGPSPTTSIYDASVVKISTATSSLLRFEIKRHISFKVEEFFFRTQ